MKRRSESKTPSAAELTALADGSLPAAKRPRVQRAVDASPELKASVQAQRRVLRAIDDSLAGAPAALRARVATMPMPPRAHAARGRRRAAGALSAFAAAAAAVSLALAGAFTAGAPSVAQAAQLAQRPAQTPAPAGQDGSATLPRLRAAGLPYPYWEDRFGYRATGVRRDQLAGRTATTVFYTDARGRQVAYTIVSGAALPPGAHTDRAVLDGVALRRLITQGHVVVTWLRDGHTCVLTGVGTSQSVLERLAAWGGATDAVYTTSAGEAL